MQVTTGDSYIHHIVQPQVTTGEIESNGSESGGASMLNLSVPLLSSTPPSTQDDLFHPDEDNADKVNEVNTLFFIIFSFHFLYLFIPN